MKRSLLFTTLLLSAGLAPAQWTRLPDFTSVTLKDVSFFNEKAGLVVGEKGAVYKTTNGGQSWELISPNKGFQYTSALAVSVSEFYVSGYLPNDDGSGTTALFCTKDGGQQWEILTSYGEVGERSQVKAQGDTLWFLSPWKGLQKSIDGGITWQLEFRGGGNTVLSDLQIDPYDPNSVFVFGVVGGFATYTGTFRHKEKGAPWDGCDPFEFGSAAAFTAFSLINDTIILFRNNYKGFMPDDTSNVLSLVYDFVRDDILPGAGTGDTVWHFTNRILTGEIPHYVTDCQFFSVTGTGYTVEEAGGVNRTPDGGLSWEREYEGRDALSAVFMVSDTLGFAVGANGTVLRRGAGASVVPQHPAATLDVRVYPSPATDRIRIEMPDNGQSSSVSIRNVTGQLVFQQDFPGGRIEVATASWPPGAYFVTVKRGSGSAVHTIIR